MFIMRIFKGNSIRFKIEYKDFEDTAAVPSDPTFKVYDSRQIEIHSEVVDTNNVLLDDIGDPIPGGYYLEYTFASSGVYTVEFNGTFDSKLTLTRNEIKVVFV